MSLTVAMSSQKPAGITFWTESPTAITVFNGFSFVAHAQPLEHYFVNPNQILEPARLESLRVELLKHDRIYCSLTTMLHMPPIQPIVDERWIFGGPAIINCRVPPTVSCHKGSFESLLGIPPSTTFSDYWTGHPTLPQKPAFISCAIANGCYWNKCLFCDYREYESKFGKKDHIATILSQLTHPESTQCVHLCVAAGTPAVLKDVLASGVQGRFTLACFCRADAGMVNFVKSYTKSLFGMYITIGVETFSYTATKILNKGFDFDAVLEMTKAIYDRGGGVGWSMMDSLPFLTMEMAEEYEKNCARAAELARRYPHLTIYNNGPAYWPSPAIASRFGPYSTMLDGHAINIISPGTPAHDANLRAARAILNSGIPVLGEKLCKALGGVE
jgi:hypothetical protein